jgi:Trehalose utilisation
MSRDDDERGSQSVRGRRKKVAAGAAVMLIVVLGGRGDQAPRPSPTGEQVHDGFAILLFTRTTEFRHDSIDNGVAAIRRLGASHGFSVDATEDPEQGPDAVLRRYRAVVFLSTTGEPLGPVQQAALERWVEGGGGWIGVHAAADAFSTGLGMANPSARGSGAIRPSSGRQSA